MSFWNELDDLCDDTSAIIGRLFHGVVVNQIDPNIQTGAVGYSFIEHPTVVITGGNITTDSNGGVIQRPSVCSSMFDHIPIKTLAYDIASLLTHR